MASPITTQGFQVSERPGISYLDPRLLSVDYAGLVPAAGRGAALGQQFAQIQEDAAMRPIRRQLAQIQIEDAQARAAMAPLERQYRLAQIAEAQQNAAIPRILPGDVMIEDTTQIYPTAIDETGARTGPDERVLGDLVQIQSEDVYGPGGVKTTRQTRKVLKPASVRATEEAAASSAAEYKAALAEAAATRADNDRIKADAARVQADAARTRAELLQSNPSIGFVDVKRADGRTYRQYFPKSDPTKIVHEVDRGELGGDIINFGGLTVSPGAGGATVVPRTPAALTVPGIDSDVAELSALVGGRAPAVSVTRTTDTFNVGQTYTDASGNRATYLGNGQWRQVQ